MQFDSDVPNPYASEVNFGSKLISYAYPIRNSGVTDTVSIFSI